MSCFGSTQFELTGQIIVFPSQKKSKTKAPSAKNKYICLCLDLPPCSHIGVIYFKKINWLPVSERVESCIATVVFKYWNGIVQSQY